MFPPSIPFVRRLCCWFTALMAAPLLTLAAEAIKNSSSEAVSFDFALYFTPKPAADPMTELARLLGNTDRRLVAVEQRTPDAVAGVAPRWVPIADYAPPSTSSFRYKAVGLDPEEAEKMAQAEQVFVITFVASPERLLAANRAACSLMADLAQVCGGHPWDEETRQVFSRTQWIERRVRTWQGDLPDLRDHVTMHAYQDPELLRIITLGMRKFGLPDLVLDGIPRNESRAVGNFVNAFMQRLAEGQQVKDGRATLVLKEIRHRAAREIALANPASGATGQIAVSCSETKRDEGDPDNVVWRLDFPEAKLKTPAERSLWAMSRLFGSTDQVTGVTSGDPEMKAASAQAKKAFFAREAQFRRGLEVNEHLLVKAPFSAGDRTEYMWVEVTKWHEKEIEGLLASDPHYVKSLRAGSRVRVKLTDVYDYIFRKADGTIEGNETGKILERRGG